MQDACEGFVHFLVLMITWELRDLPAVQSDCSWPSHGSPPEVQGLPESLDARRGCRGSMRPTSMPLRIHDLAARQRWT